MLYDTHVHIGTSKIKPTPDLAVLPGYQMYSKNGPASFIRKALSHQVRRALIFPFPFPDQSKEKLNREVIDAARQFPYFFTPLILADSVEDVERHLEKVAGVKDHFYLHGKTGLPSPELLEILQSRGKIYLFHAHMFFWKEYIQYVIKNFPDLKCIVAHCARLPNADVKSAVDRVSELDSWIPRRSRENVFFETSTVRHSTAIRKMIDTFGASHILWGSDFPYYAVEGEDVLQKESDVVERALVDLPDRELVETGNFRRLFGLEREDIRLADITDAASLLAMIEAIDEHDAHFLALKLKRQTIRDRVKKGSHIIIANGERNRLLGFLRWTDRPNGGMIIEEIYVHPLHRGKGLASRMVAAICPSFTYAEAKSFADNKGITGVFFKQGFIPTPTRKGTMVNWRKQ